MAMGDDEHQPQPAHSAEHFGATRDHWWNLDFLRLMAQRWRLDSVRDVLDVGCGIGHWGTLLAAIMPSEARITGVDREAQWIQQASARAAERGLAARFSFRQGEAEHLPFAADSFDFTTCQTVLIHLPNPSAALAEMMRVTKPGGLVAVAEPNNLSETLLLDSISNQASVADILDIVRLQLTCERGKVALGEGDNSLGDRVPGLFAQLGFSEIEVHVNDKATAIFPPYTSAAQRVFVADERDRATRGKWNWTEAETRRLYLAGGGHEPDFAALFSNALAARQNIVRGLDAGTYHGVIGGEFYLVSGRKRDAKLSGSIDALTPEA